MSKRTVIVALTGANLLLLAGLLFSTLSMPSAIAQSTESGGSMIAVTGRVDADIDAMFLLDMEQGRLNVLIPRRDANGQLAFVAQRNIGDDFKAIVEAGEAKGKGSKK